jgi:Uma2 family endonuclease
MTLAAAPKVMPTAARPPERPASDAEPPAAPALHEPRPHKWTVGEFMKMIEMGLISGHVDLVDGEVIEMPAAMGDKHAISIERLLRWLVVSFPPPYFIHCQATHRFADDLTREPDAALMGRDPRPDDVLHELPLLVIEVSDESLHFDLTVKRLEYAKVGVPEYWVIDIPHRRVRVFRNPDQAAADPERAYQADLIFEKDAALSPLCRQEAVTTASALLPPEGF